jgi:hypothetical protein
MSGETAASFMTPGEIANMAGVNLFSGAQMTTPPQTFAGIPGVVPVNAAGAAVVNAQASFNVPLPPTVQAQQNAFAAAAGPIDLNRPVMTNTYPPCAMKPELMPEFLKVLWGRLYYVVFTKCGWAQTQQGFAFTNPMAVLDPVPIDDIIKQFGADNFVMEYDTLNAQGQFAVEKCQGYVRGIIFKNSGLPGFEIYLNINGQRFKRTFVPQNPQKRNTQNAYSKTAAEAQQGHMIAWVYRGEANNMASFKEKCAVKIRDNVYEVIQ